jgi:hypothetical protein
VERVEALLLWSDPYATAKVFGGGLYVLICLRHLVCGAIPPQAFRLNIIIWREDHILPKVCHSQAARHEHHIIFERMSPLKT